MILETFQKRIKKLISAGRRTSRTRKPVHEILEKNCEEVQQHQ